jgi:hypothetical protein
MMDEIAMASQVYSLRFVQILKDKPETPKVLRYLQILFRFCQAYFLHDRLDSSVILREHVASGLSLISFIISMSKSASGRLAAAETTRYHVRDTALRMADYFCRQILEFSA